ncbi:hypothetical protein AB0I52_27010, partial [Streptomyces sp. NPDC050423]
SGTRRDELLVPADELTAGPAHHGVRGAGGYVVLSPPGRPSRSRARSPAAPASRTPRRPGARRHLYCAGGLVHRWRPIEPGTRVLVVGIADHVQATDEQSR